MNAKKYRIMYLILLIAVSLLWCNLALALLIPLSYGSIEAYVGDASLQLARSNAFAKNALILQNGPADLQSQALSDMQVALPLFTDEQNKIIHNKDQGVQGVLQETQPSYLAVATAVAAMIRQPSDARQVIIIAQNSRAYNLLMSQYLALLRQQANDWNTHLVILQEVILGLLGASNLSFHLIGMRKLRDPSHLPQNDI